MTGPKGFLIAVDGPAGCGKSTVSRLLAARLNYLYLDTGAMYRSVALQASRMGMDFDDGKGLEALCAGLVLRFETAGSSQRTFIGEEDVSLVIRSPEMDLLSSRISAVREVREAMTALQRRIGRDGGLVAEGRDMGTVVFPDADFKFFVTASPEVRVQRRYLERLGRGEAVTREEVERELRQRDEQDAGRSIAPLMRATDAILVETTHLNPEQVLDAVVSHIWGEEGEKKT